MTLEIKIKETITVLDVTDYNAQYASADEIVKLVKKAYWKFVNSEEATLDVTIKKQGNKSPPTLGIHVSDVADLKEVLS